MSRRVVIAVLVVMLGLCIVSTGCAGKKKKAAVPAGPMYQLSPTMDSSVMESSPDTNFGTQQLMTAAQIHVTAPPVDEVWRAYVYFDTSTVPATTVIDSVELRLNIYGTINSIGGASFLFDICDVNATWVETTITWNNAPTYSSVGTFVGPADGFTGWFTITSPGLQSLVEDWVDGTLTNNGLCLRLAFTSTHADGFDCYTRESASSPQLIIRYTTP